MKLGRFTFILLMGVFLAFTPATSQAGLIGRIVTAPFRLVRAIRQRRLCRGRCGQRGCFSGRCGSRNRGNFQRGFGGGAGAAPAPSMAANPAAAGVGPIGGAPQAEANQAQAPPGAAVSGQPTEENLSANGNIKIELIAAHPIKPDKDRDIQVVEGRWKPVLDIKGKPWESKRLIVTNDGLIAVRDHDRILRKVWQDKNTGTLYVRNAEGKGRPLTLDHDKCFLHELGWYYLNRKEGTDPIAAQFLKHYFNIDLTPPPSETQDQLPAPPLNADVAHAAAQPTNDKRQERPIDDSARPRVVEVTSREAIPEGATSGSCSTDGTCTYIGKDGTQYRLKKAQATEPKPVQASQPKPQTPRATQSIFGGDFQSDADYDAKLNQAGKDGRIVMLTFGSPTDGVGLDCHFCDELHQMLRQSIAPSNPDLAIYETDVAKPQHSSKITQSIARGGIYYPRVYLMKFSKQQNRWIRGQSFTQPPSYQQLQGAIASLRSQP